MLGELNTFLDRHPDEVVVLFLQDYVDPIDVETAFTRDALIDLVYTLTPGTPLPTLREMIESGRRILVFSENVGGQPAPPWYHSAFAWTQETQYVFRSPTELNCDANRGTADAPFFSLNHWITTSQPAPRDGEVLNQRDFIVERARECADTRGRPVNFIAVNFYEVGELVGALEELNARE
jgi:hypothetical protein